MVVNNRKQIRLKEFDYKSKSFVYFITICAADKQSYFLNKSIAKTIINQLKYRHSAQEIKLYCFCVMPNHLHILISLSNNCNKNLNNWVSAYKRYTAKIIGDTFNIKPLWQANFYDHVIRKEESLVDIAEYILNNPVRKGLVVKWQDYPYSRLVDNLPV